LATSEIPSSLTVAYVGSKGTHLALHRDINQLASIPQSQNPYHGGQPMTAADCASGTVNGAAPTSAGNLAAGERDSALVKLYYEKGTQWRTYLSHT
jgi:hypothetical protein